MKQFLTAGVTLAALLMWNATSSANLVVNGGFETGDFTGWTQISAPFGSAFGVSNVNPHNGNYAAYFGGTTPGDYDGISQTLSTAIGTSYTVSFWLMNDDSPPNSFQTYWGGNQILTVDNASSFPYTQYTFTETATSNSTALLFQGYQVPGYFYLDDVSVTPTTSAVPEPSTLAMAAVAGLAGLAYSLLRRRLRGAEARCC
ncbi:MAG: carbohydrate binding domain-containing protein [Isosphaeraceae bacterium]